MDDNLQPIHRWYQIKSQNALIAGFWAIVFLASLLAINAAMTTPSNDVMKPIVLVALLISSFCAAIGSLFGRPLISLLVGAGVFCLVAVGFLAALSIAGI